MKKKLFRKIKNIIEKELGYLIDNFPYIYDTKTMNSHIHNGIEFSRMIIVSNKELDFLENDTSGLVFHNAIFLVKNYNLRFINFLHKLPIPIFLTE
jgi:hypothetical protein